MATEQRSDVVGAAHLVLASGATPLHPEEAVFEVMLAGWQAQPRSRCLRETTIHDAVRAALDRAFQPPSLNGTAR
jgi:hypothetical protein